MDTSAPRRFYMTRCPDEDTGGCHERASSPLNDAPLRALFYLRDRGVTLFARPDYHEYLYGDTGKRFDKK